MVAKMKYRIILEQDEDGIYTAICSELPGCISQGKTRVEAIDNIKDAMEGYILSLNKHKESVTLPINEDYLDFMLIQRIKSKYNEYVSLEEIEKLV